MNDSPRFATVEISGPGRNLLNPEVLAQIRSGLERAAEDPAVSGIILTGSGDVFCGGLDVPAIKAGADPVPFYEGLVGILRLLPKLPKPIVAAVNGDALAGGAGFVAAADYVVAVPEARIGSFEVSVGVWPVVAQVALIKRIGARAAIQNIASGEPFSAERAREVGLVNRVVSSDQLRGAADEWLAQAARGGGVVAAGRPSVYRVEEMSYDDALVAALGDITSAYAK
ncbi:MAG: enoyl-CoA hydratase/isomerase family protein [Candidatus Leucobacter sulfamidivorax]|nr:enoyl-CoA hydratase/isomerase family protein [Candidatus Leucobacter sulfamidivorax]